MPDLAPGPYKTRPARVVPATAEAYHADDLGLPEPSLSAGIAKRMLVSPAHAKAALDNPRPPTAVMEMGSLVHDLLLGQESRIGVVAADDWRTKEARERRDEARSRGLIPVLAAHYNDAAVVADRAYARLRESEVGVAWLEEPTEQAVVWQQDSIWCRARFDVLPRYEGGVLVCRDLKTTAGLAQCGEWLPRALGRRDDIQAAHYLAGARALFPDAIRAVWQWVVIETVPPYGVEVIACPQPLLATIASRDLSRVRRLWRYCLDSGEWPAYSGRVVHPDTPAWFEAKALAAEDADAYDAAFAAQQPVEAP